VRVKVGSTLAVSLEGNPSTGYTWELAPGENPLIEQVGQAEFEANSKLLGAPGKIILRFRATAPGQQALSLVYHRPFEKNTLPEKIFAVALIVTGEDGGSPQPTTLGQPALVVYPPAGMKGWLTYSDPTYGFSFQYPPEWKLEPARGTMIGHAVWLTPNTTSLARLQIAYKRAGDQAQIGRTGLGSGDVVQLGQVLFLGKAIDREVLVFAGKDMTVRYTCSGCMQRGDLIFGFDLDYLGNWADPTALPDDVLANADWIVASVQLSGASQ
jgi:inhibitor of cysteine peptidase